MRTAAGLWYVSVPSIDASEQNSNDNLSILTKQDYTNNFQKKNYEIFNLKQLLYEEKKRFYEFLHSKNVHEKTINTISEQEKEIARLRVQLEQTPSFINKVQFLNQNVEYNELKEKLEKVFDDYLQLEVELKKRDQERYDDAIETSTLFDDGAQASLDNLELRGEIQNAIIENEKLRKSIANLSKEKDELNYEIKELKKTLQEKNQILDKKNANVPYGFDLNDIRNVISQLETLTETNKQLLQENFDLKQNKQSVEHERETNAKLSEQLNSANEMIRNFKSIISNLENGNSDLMNALSVLDFEDILPKFDEIAKENEILRKQNNQISEELLKSDENIAELKKTAYELTIENNKLQNLTMLLEKQTNEIHESKIKEYNEISAKNLELKNKRRALLSSIERLKSGNNTFIEAHSIEVTTKLNSPISNIDAMLISAKNENDYLNEKVEQLHIEINQQLYSKLSSITNKLVSIHVLQKENERLQTTNDVLQTSILELQDKVLILEQKLEFAYAEKEDLISEMNELKKKIEILNENADTPQIYNNDESVLNQLQKKITILEMENQKLNQKNNAETDALKSENQKMLQDQISITPIKHENNMLKLQTEQLQTELQLERSMRIALSKDMIEIVHFTNDKMTAFLDNFEDHFNEMLSNIQRVLSNHLTLSQYILNGNRTKFQQFVQFSSSIIMDMKTGIKTYLQSLNHDTETKEAKYQLSRDDRKTLSKLQRKWTTSVAGDLAQYIDEQNEQSLLMNCEDIRNSQTIKHLQSSQFKNEITKYNFPHIDTQYENEITQQLQQLIHVIWSAFRNNISEPKITSKSYWKKNGSQIVENVILLFNSKLETMKNTISQQKQQIEDIQIINSGALPSNIESKNLIQMLIHHIGSLTKQMNQQHQELITFVGNNTSSDA